LKKPESAAQPGSGKPGVGQSQFPKCWRGVKPQERKLRFLRKSSGTGFVKRSSGAKGQERRVDFLPKVNSLVGQENLKVYPQGETRRGSIEPIRYYWLTW
jgi:hypothetical protein